MENYTDTALMTPAGYMVKSVAPRPDGVKAPHVLDLYSVSLSTSAFFYDQHINHWHPNGRWLFDSKEIIARIAHDHAIDISEMTISYDEFFHQEFDEVSGECRAY